MKPLHLSEIARMSGGRLHGEDVVVDAIATDTRALPAAGSALFVALKGENFDGHAHVAAAAEQGVVAAMVSHAVDSPLPQVVVADTQHDNIRVWQPAIGVDSARRCKSSQCKAHKPDSFLLRVIPHPLYDIFCLYGLVSCPRECVCAPHSAIRSQQTKLLSYQRLVSVAYSSRQNTSA